MTTEQARAKYLRSGQGTIFRARGDLFFFKVVGADNDDAFSMCEAHNAPLRSSQARADQPPASSSPSA